MNHFSNSSPNSSGKLLPLRIGGRGGVVSSPSRRSTGGLGRSGGLQSDEGQEVFASREASSQAASSFCLASFARVDASLSRAGSFVSTPLARTYFESTRASEAESTSAPTPAGFRRQSGLLV